MRFSAMLIVSVVAMFAYQQLSAQSTTTATIVRPYITEISPKNLTTDVDSTVVTIRGGRFQEGATVLFNGRNVRIIRQESDSLLIVVIPGEYLLLPDIATLQIENPNYTKIGWRVAILNGCAFDVRTNRLSPSTAIALSQAVTINLQTQLPIEIQPDARLFFNGIALRTIRILPPNNISAEIPAQLATTSGTFAVQLVQPRGCSIALPFTFTPPIDTNLAPKITQILTRAWPLQNGLMIISGMNFSTNSIVRLGITGGIVVNATSNLLIVRFPNDLPLSLVYQLSITNPDGQAATDWWLPLTVGTNVSNENTFISPNPVHNILTFTTTLNRASHLRCTLRTTLGAVVMEERHVAAAGEFSTTLDVSAFPSGIYFLEVSDDAGGRWMQKVVKD